MTWSINNLTNYINNLTVSPKEYKKYNKDILTNLCDLINIASETRKKGFAPSLEVESQIALDLGDRVEHLLQIPVGTRLRELLKQYRVEQAALILAEEVALGQFGFFSKDIALDLGVRVGLAVVTEGITVAPIQGVSSVKIKKNGDGTDYAAVYFAGPIRAAGGTEAAFSLVITNHIRKALGLDNYRPGAWGDDEVGRFIEELRVYERDVGNFQFKVSDTDIHHTILHLPVEIDGVETDPVEVVVHRGLRRIDTDRVRGGALRVLNDGVIGRSRKLLKVIEDLAIPDWEWLSELHSGKQQGSDETGVTGSHFEDVISGRPVLSSPKKPGGFRLRYGRSYNTGLATVGIHPAVATLLEYPFVVGTQVKVDMPGKAATIAFVDTLETPIVTLKDGSVIKIEDTLHAEKIRDDLVNVLYLGDILVSYGDFLENNVTLVPSPYVEEWWCQDLETCIKERYQSLEDCSQDLGIDLNHLHSLLFHPLEVFPSAHLAFHLSQKLNVPLHPRYLFYWEVLLPSQILHLREILRMRSSCPDACVLATPNEGTIKVLLEAAGIPHHIEDNQLVIEGDTAYSLMKTLGLSSETVSSTGWKNVQELLSILAKIPIKGKASTFIGLRVGRPEKAMPRRMKPPVHVLFPIGKNGGSTRNILQAALQDHVDVELISMVCSECNALATSARCRKCGGITNVTLHCPNCNRPLQGAICPACKMNGLPYTQTSFPIKHFLEEATKIINYRPTTLLKGVQGLTNATRIPEPLEKGMLRQKFGLSIYKDGTIRFDATNAPLTHFKASQIGTPIETLRRLGYEKDIQGDILQSEDQILEPFIQDIVLPIEAGNYLVNITKFLDELLTQLYHEKPYYNANVNEDLIGHLVVGLAPHTSVGVIGRVIGFTPAQVCFAHPYWHSAKRRDCDGDEDAIMVLLDVLINFSKDFLPAQIGGLMDAPLLYQPIIIPDEVQRQAHNFDISNQYPKEFYEATLKMKPPNSLTDVIDIIRNRLRKERQFYDFHFTHHTNHIVCKKPRSAYSTLKTLNEKLDKQIELAMKVNSVDVVEVVSSVLRSHLLPDIIGNMKAYTSQTFRCKSCGEQYRRFPLKGVCLSCGGTLQANVTRASVEKYLALGLRLCKRFNIENYLRTRFEIASEELSLLFPSKTEGTQLEIIDFLKD